MEEFAVYVLYSENHNRLYIGQSSISLQRFHWHNEFAKKGFTIRYRPWKMVHIEFFPTKSEALKRETALKSGQGREWIRKEILLAMKNAGFISA